MKLKNIANDEYDTYRHCISIVICIEFNNSVDDDDNDLLNLDKEEIISKAKEEDKDEDEDNEQKENNLRKKRIN